jgi:hypothetical protein
MRWNPPNVCEFLFTQAALTENFKSGLSTDIPSTLSVPCPEYGIVVLLLCLGQRPRNIRRGSSLPLLVVSLERLLQRKPAGKLLLRKLQRSPRTIWCRQVHGHKRARHHLQSGVYEPSNLRNKRTTDPSIASESQIRSKSRSAYAGRWAQIAARLLGRLRR